MADTIDLRIRMLDEKYAIHTLNDIQRVVNELNKKVISLRIDKSGFESQVQYLEARIKSFQELLKDDSLSEKQRENLNRKMAGDEETLKLAKEAVKETNLELQKQSELLSAARAMKADMSLEEKEQSEQRKREAQEVAEVQRTLDEEERKRKRELSEWERQDQEEKQKAIQATIAQYERLGMAISAVGDALHAVGSLSQWTSDFAGSIGNAFSGMSNLFSVDLTDTIGKTLTVMGTRAITGNLDKIRSRFDIMSTFADYMELAGVGADEANEALQRVNESILGLPIGLDESAQRLRRYQMFMDDLESATNLTIGVQKAITAGGASAQMKNYAYTQIDRLLTTGTLTQSRQWYALMNGLGVSMRFIRQAMGVEGMTNRDLAAGLASGNISSGAFLKALQDLGEGTSEAARQLDSALSIYKGTLESWVSNIQFAAIRGGETVLKALNTTLEDSTGKPIVGYMEIVRNTMNDMYKGIGSYITENPQNITQGLGAIERFMDAIGRFSASDIADKAFNRLLETADLFTSIIERLPVEETEDFIAFATTIAGPLGKLFSVLGGGLPILYGVYDRFKDFDFEQLFERAAQHAESLSNAVSKLLGVLPDGIMRELLAFGMTWGKPLATALNAVGDAFNHIGKAWANMPQDVKWDGSLLSLIFRFASQHASLSLAGAGLVALAGGISAVYSATSYVDKQALAEALDLEKIEEAALRTKSLNEQYDQIANSWGDTFSNLESKFEQARTLFDEIGKLDALLYTSDNPDANQSIIEKEQLALKELQNLIPDIEGSIDGVTGAWDDSLEKVYENRTAILDYIESAELAEAAAEHLNELFAAKMDMLIQQATNNEIIEEYQKKLDAIQEQVRNLGSPEEDHSFLDEGIFNTDSKDFRETANGLTTSIQMLEEEMQPYVEENDKLAASLADVEQRIGAVNQIIKENTEGGVPEEAAEALGIVADGVEDVNQSLSMTEEEIDALEQAFADLQETVANSLGSIVDGFNEVDEVSAVAIDDMIANLTGQVDELETLLDNLDTIQQFLYDYGSALSDGFKGAIAEMTAAPGDYLGEIRGVADEIERALESSDFTKIAGLGIEYGDRSRLLQDIVETSSATSQMASDFDRIVETLKDNPDIMNGSLKDLVTNNALFSYDASKVQGIQESLGIVTEEVPATLATMDEAVINSTALIAGEEGETSLDSAVLQLQGDLTTFCEETLPALNDAIDASGTIVSTYATDTLEKKLIANLNTATDSGEALKQKITELDGVFLSASSASSGLLMYNATVMNLSSYFDNAASSAANLISQIEALNEATGGTMEIPGNLQHAAAFPALERANGGPVYLAKGGFALMRPHGTDTVPAMLTPGEFVIRKRAVDSIGANVLAMINRLDIPNAIDALMSKVHMPFGHQFVTYDNRKSYDNHATVNQNIYTQNPSFTYRRASRFAHAL